MKMSFDEWLQRNYPEIAFESQMQPGLREYMRRLAADAWVQSTNNTITMLKEKGLIR